MHLAIHKYCIEFYWSFYLGKIYLDYLQKSVVVTP